MTLAQRPLIIATALLLCLGAAGCGSSSQSDAPPTAELKVRGIEVKAFDCGAAPVNQARDVAAEQLSDITELLVCQPPADVPTVKPMGFLVRADEPRYGQLISALSLPDEPAPDSQIACPAIGYAAPPGVIARSSGRAYSVILPAEVCGAVLPEVDSVLRSVLAAGSK